jgi:hypothetical protein
MPIVSPGSQGPMLPVVLEPPLESVALTLLVGVRVVVGVVVGDVVGSTVVSVLLADADADIVLPPLSPHAVSAAHKARPRTLSER